MNTLLIAVFAAFLIQIATSFAPQIRIRNCNAITKRTSSPFTVIYSSNGPPELQSNDEEPQGRQLSGTMKEKMKRELQSQGGDPNYSAGPVLGNPILIISGVIAILVILGGKGYFF